MRLSVSRLMIDQSFIRDMPADAGDLSIVKGVIGLVRAFNCPVIAEGVETQAYGQRLLAVGCELDQGHAIARPMPADQLAHRVDRWRAPATWKAA